jgi:arylsulfatase A-like enzyme
MTGKYASSTGMVINELRLNPNQKCLGHVLSAAGYETSYLGKWHLWAKELGGHREIRNAFTPPGLHRLGFDGFWAAYNFNHDNYKAWYFRDTPQPHRIRGYGPDHFTDLAIQRIRTHARGGRPFALVLSYSPPHDPWTADNVPAEWLDKFRGVEFPLAGLPIPKQVEGVDLSGLARGQPGNGPDLAFLQGMGHTCDWSDGFEWRALRDRRFTYAVYRSDGRELLFDNVADPRQAKDLAADAAHREKLAELRGKLRRKMAELGDTFEACSWYRDHWTKDRVILRGATGEFRRK